MHLKGFFSSVEKSREIMDLSQQMRGNSKSGNHCMEAMALKGLFQRKAG
jgi:hypothetical protein